MNSENIASKQQEKRKKLAIFAKNLPDVPGVYLMRMQDDFLLYIGKASSLQKRVGSYFLDSVDLGPWKQGMLKDIDHIVFAGMGGSGAIGDIFSAILSKTKIKFQFLHY